MVNYFSPTLGMLRGQQLEQGQAQAAHEGFLNERAILDQLARRKAAAGMGSSNYFTGFEGVPGAERPNYLKELFASGDPDEAFKFEALHAAPFTTARAIDTAGKIELAKKKADMQVYTEAFKQMLGEDGLAAPVMDRMNPGGESESSIDGVEPPSAPPSRSNLNSLSGRETTMEIGPMGPKMSVKAMSPFDKAIKIGEDSARQITAGVAKDKEAREAEQQAHDNVRKVTEAIAATQKAMQTRDMPWEEGRQRIEQLKQDLATFVNQRDRILGGRPAPGSPTPGAPAPMSSPTAVTPGPAGRFTEKEQGALDVENRKEQMTAANKEVENARLGARKILKFKGQMKELFDLVTKQDIGHPTMEGVPGAVNILSMSRANAQVKKLNEAIINMFAEPGQSQMMNTIVERQMQGAVVPGIFTDPQTNKMNAAILRSNMEHLESLPTFLEKWQKRHGNTLDGATEAWIDYTSNNPIYTFTKDARGRVKVQENSHVIPLDRWVKLKDTGGIRVINGKTFVREQDGSWVEK